ncbi:hypothetical protein GCM10022255_117190 [Dactylosporangium darangshiense]|uniref:FBA domain-containing protein n=1 Tax=Dactylosporangium darangshiense TaxID=579108 RepID=A0ABP8DWM1_9ACTN
MWLGWRGPSVSGSKVAVESDPLPVAEVAMLPDTFFIVVGAVEDEWDNVDDLGHAPAVWDDRFVLVAVDAQRELVRARLWRRELTERVAGRPLVFDGSVVLTDGSLRIGEAVGPASLRYRLVAPGKSVRLRIWADGRDLPVELDIVVLIE